MPPPEFPGFGPVALDRSAQEWTVGHVPYDASKLRRQSMSTFDD